MMKIAYICADMGIPVFGQKGCSIHVQEITRSFLKLGADVHLFANRWGGEALADLKAIKIHPLTPIAKMELAEREKTALSLNEELRSHLQHESFDLIYERYSLWSYAGMEYAENKGIPGILEVNSPLIEEQAQHRGLIHREEAEKVAERVFQAAKAIVAVSHGVYDHLLQHIGDRQKIHIIPNGVNPKRFSGQVNRENPFTVGFVGTLKPWHGISNLITAFAQFHHNHPEARLLIVGDGPQKQQIIEEIETNHLESAVELTGAVSPTEIPQLLSKMSIGVAPYPYIEQFYFSPLKIYEYMAAGLPVIASEIGQISQLVDHGVNGLLVPPDDIVSLTNALEQLWRSPQLAEVLGKNARDTILENHTWDKVATKILKLIN